MSRQIIGITGKKRAGKDTAASFLNKKYDYKIYSFADPIKDMLKVLVNYVDVNLNFYLNNDKEQKIDPFNASYRKLTQTLGTEWGRNLIDDKIWIELLDFNSQWEGKIVIPDIRFENEAEWVVNNGGIIINIVRDSRYKDSHSSEQGVPERFITETIHNNDTVEKLHTEIEKILNSNFDILKDVTIHNAFMDIMDGMTVSDLRLATGLPLKRCQEIYEIFTKCI